MQYKIDENLPVEIADMLLKNGHDAKIVIQQQLKGVQDSILINLCKQENRVLVTLDTDFADISKYAPEEYAGIIVLRVGNQAKGHVIKIFQSVINSLSVEPINNHLWVVEETIIRIRGKEI